jgi:hypothetical protein
MCGVNWFREAATFVSRLVLVDLCSSLVSDAGYTEFIKVNRRSHLSQQFSKAF